MLGIKKGILRDFDGDIYTATVEIAGSSQAYLDGVAVARNIPSAEMTIGRNVALVFFDAHNAKEAVVVAVY